MQARKAGRPTTEQTAQLKETIMRAAFRIFTRDGFANATMEQIAAEAGTTRRSVASRFATKNDLLVAVLERRSDEYWQNVFKPASLLAHGPLETIRDACRVMFEDACQEGFIALYRLIISETAKNPAAGDLLIRINNTMADRLAVLVTRAQREGHFKDQDPDAAATALIGVFLSNPGNRRAFGDPQFMDAARRRTYFDSLWGLVAQASA